MTGRDLIREVIQEGEAFGLRWHERLALILLAATLSVLSRLVADAFARALAAGKITVPPVPEPDRPTDLPAAVWGETTSDPKPPEGG